MFQQQQAAAAAAAAPAAARGRVGCHLTHRPHDTHTQVARRTMRTNERCTAKKANQTKKSLQVQLASLRSRSVPLLLLPSCLPVLSSFARLPLGLRLSTCLPAYLSPERSSRLARKSSPTGRTGVSNHRVFGFSCWYRVPFRSSIFPPSMFVSITDQVPGPHQEEEQQQRQQQQ